MESFRFPDHTSGLQIRLFGAFHLGADDRTLPPLRTRKGRWLLSLLILRHRQIVERTWLAESLWPESSNDLALANLRRSLTDLRQTLGSHASCLDAPTSRSLRISLPEASVDLLAFDAAVVRGDDRSLHLAVSLVRGPLLEDCSEDWAVPDRQARLCMFSETLQTLGARAMSAGQPLLAVVHLRRLVESDPYCENSARLLMTALAEGGEVAGVIQVYRNLQGLLHRELSAEPSTDTIALFKHLRATA